MEVAAAVMWQRLTVIGRITVIVRMAMHTREFPLEPVLADYRIGRPMCAYLANTGHDQPLHDQQQQGQVTETMTQAIEHRGQTSTREKTGVRRYRTFPHQTLAR